MGQVRCVLGCDLRADAGGRLCASVGMGCERVADIGGDWRCAGRSLACAQVARPKRLLLQGR